MNKEEKQLKSTLLNQNRVLSLYEDAIELPNGKEGKRIWVDHLPSVAIVPITENNEIILIKQYRYAIKQEIYEIPAGNMDKENESPEECAQRELAEEIGYKAKKLSNLWSGYMLPGYNTEYMNFFLAQDLYEERLPGDDDEFIELAKMPFEKALKMIETNEIIDGKTVLGIKLTQAKLV